MRKKKIESCLLAAAVAAVITVPAFISGFMVGITQRAIATSRAEAYRKAIQEGEKQ